MHKYLLLKDKEIDHALFPPFLVNTQCIPFFRPAREAVISGMKALLDEHRKDGRKLWSLSV